MGTVPFVPAIFVKQAILSTILSALAYLWDCFSNQVLKKCTHICIPARFGEKSWRVRFWECVSSFTSYLSFINCQLNFCTFLLFLFIVSFFVDSLSKARFKYPFQSVNNVLMGWQHLFSRSVVFNHCFFVWFLSIPGSAQDIHLNLHLGITPGDAQGNLLSARNWTQNWTLAP